MIKRLLLLVGLLIGVYFPAFAQEFPAGCKLINFKFSQQNLILNTANKPNVTVFLFHNISQKSFWLDHLVMHPSASAGWGSKLDQDNWSALLLNNNKSFTVTCSQIQPGTVDYWPCRKFLKVCELQNVSLNKMDGSYWLAENQPLPILIKTIKERGVSWR